MWELSANCQWKWQLHVPVALVIFLADRPPNSTRPSPRPQASTPLTTGRLPRAERIGTHKHTSRLPNRQERLPGWSATRDDNYGWRNDDLTRGFLVPLPPTLQPDHFLLQNRFRTHKEIGIASAATMVRWPAGDIAESSIPAVPGRDMGRPSEGGSQEEGVAHEEETQADGGQGPEGRHIVM